MRILKPLIGIVMLTVVGFVATAYAQGNSPIAESFTELKSLVNTVITQLAAVQDTLTTIAESSQGNTRFTPPLYSASTTRCSVVNISEVSRTVQAQIWIFASQGGGSIPPSPAHVVAESTRTLPPGGLIVVESGQVVFWCKFTVIDGSRDDIRGSIEAYQANIASPITALPAE